MPPTDLPNREPSSERARDAQPRVIGAVASIGIVVGSMLGVGIFLSPPVVAQHVDSQAAFFGVWVLAGLASLAGAVAYGELGAMMPRAGGDYAFQRAALGPSAAFATGWVLFAAVFAGSIASMAVGVAEHQLPALFGFDPAGVLLTLPGGLKLTSARAIALVLVVSLTALNFTGARPSSLLQSVMTGVPMAALVLLGVWALSSSLPTATPRTEASHVAASDWTGIVLAYLPAYFAYSGWNAVVYVAGEVRDPGRHVPRSALIGTSAVMILYLFLNLAFERVLGIGGLRAAGEAGTATASLLGGDGAALALNAVIAFAIVACLNATILGGARIAFAMAREGMFWQGAGVLRAKGCVPARALAVQGAWVMVLILGGAFEQLLNLVSLAMQITGALTVIALFVLRARRPDLHRPYRALGYPVVPALYLGTNVIVLAVLTWRAVTREPGVWYPLIGLAILAVAFCAHWLAQRLGAGSEAAS